jgi:hypothetical protein
MLGLETGKNGYVEAFVFRGGQRFGFNWKRWLKVRFYQNSAPSRAFTAGNEKFPTARPWYGYISPRYFCQIVMERGFMTAFYLWRNFWSEGTDFWDKPGGNAQGYEKQGGGL